MQKKYLFIIIVAAIVAVFITLLSSRGQPVSPVSSGKITVASSFYPLYFFASQIGGEKADVINITPAGAEPHDYEPTARDIAEIEKSDLLILNGGGLEAWGESIKRNINSERTRLVIAGEGLKTEEMTEEEKNIIDPHIWLSPLLAEKMAEKIFQGFKETDPANAAYYQTNADILKSKLRALDEKYKSGLALCAQNKIITTHAAFGYLANAYHLEQVAITGISPDAEPSPRKLGELADFIKKNNIKYIFFETLASPRLSQTLSVETGAATLELNPLEGLSDEEISRGKNYFSEMENNLANLQLALQCMKK